MIAHHLNSHLVSFIQQSYCYVAIHWLLTDGTFVPGAIRAGSITNAYQLKLEFLEVHRFDP